MAVGYNQKRAIKHQKNDYKGRLQSSPGPGIVMRMSLRPIQNGVHQACCQCCREVCSGAGGLVT
jgi:hypothetical protein